ERRIGMLRGLAAENLHVCAQFREPGNPRNSDRRAETTIVAAEAEMAHDVGAPHAFDRVGAIALAIDLQRQAARHRAFGIDEPAPDHAGVALHEDFLDCAEDLRAARFRLRFRFDQLAGPQLCQQLVVILERSGDVPGIYEPTALQHDAAVADVAQQTGTVARQYDDLAAADPALHPLLGLAHEVGITRPDPFVHQHDVVLDTRRNREARAHRLSG